ncbi:MAG: hypothetical protein Q7S86_00515, partial [bacterium]|nr:hypothetical protein [bacterium]
MTLSFSYDLQKDIENYLITTRSINNKQPTKVQSLYIARYGATFEREKLETFIREYIEDEKIAFEQKIHQIESDWQNIEQPFFDKVAAIVGSPSPIDVLHVYLTTDTRCSYNIE